MRVTQNDVLSLLGKYVEERTLVLAVFVTPSRSVARVTGAIRVSVDGSGPHLAVGKDDNNSQEGISELSLTRSSSRFLGVLRFLPRLRNTRFHR